MEILVSIHKIIRNSDTDFENSNNDWESLCRMKIDSKNKDHFNKPNICHSNYAIVILIKKTILEEDSQRDFRKIIDCKSLNVNNPISWFRYLFNKNMI